MVLFLYSKKGITIKGRKRLKRYDGIIIERSLRSSRSFQVKMGKP